MWFDVVPYAIAGTVQLGQEGSDTRIPQGLEVLVHGGQRGQEMAGIGLIIESDDADVLRHPNTPPRKPVDKAEGHLIVRGKDRRQVWDLQQLIAGLESRLGMPVPHGDGRHRESGIV